MMISLMTNCAYRCKSDRKVRSRPISCRSAAHAPRKAVPGIWTTREPFGADDLNLDGAAVFRRPHQRNHAPINEVEMFEGFVRVVDDLTADDAHGLQLRGQALQRGLRQSEQQTVRNPVLAAEPLHRILDMVSRCWRSRRRCLPGCRRPAAH